MTPSRCERGHLLRRRRFGRSPSRLRVAETLRRVSPERVNDHNGCNGCTQRSLGCAPVRSLPSKPLLTGGFRRTHAHGRERTLSLGTQKVVGAIPLR